MRLSRFRPAPAGLFCLVVCWGLFPLPALASAESEALTRTALERLKAKDADGALDALARARRADATDPRVPFAQGHALNRLNRFREAYAALTDAAALGARGRAVDYETGWAAVQIGLTPVAVERLERVVAAEPKNARAQLLLGSAYIQARRFGAAKAAISTATSLDAGLEPAGLLALARIAHLEGDRDETAALMGRLMREAPDSGPAQALRESVRARARERIAEKPWSVYIAPSVGRNTNVIALSDEIVRPADITGKDSAYYSIEAGGRYVLPDLQGGALTLGYDLQYRDYFSLKDQDVLENGVSAAYVHELHRDVTAAVRLRGSHARVDNERFRNGWSLRPSVTWRPAGMLELEPFYSRAVSDYAPPTQTPGLLDRDSTLQTFGLRAAAPLFDLPVVGEFGVARLHNAAAGDDYDWRGTQLWLRVTARLPERFVADAQFSVLNARYTNPNSLAPTTPPGATAFGFERDDRIEQFAFRLTRPLTDTLSGFFQFNYTDADSNLPVFSYKQKDGRIGLVASF
jgi:Flp pilus assembly protein TadD